MTTTRLTALLLAACCVLPAAAREPSFPSKPVKVVVPYSAGNPSDAFARWMADAMSQDLGQPFIVENRAGGNTMVGAAAVANAPADGYTLLQSTNSLILNPLLYKKLPYEASNLDVLLIAMEAPLVIVIHPGIPARDIKEFVAYTKQKKGGGNYSSIGTGNAMQLASEMLKSRTGADLTHVPYNGRGADALAAVIAGDVSMFLTVAAQALPHIQSGKLRALAVLSRERVPTLPDVPTTAELGLPEIAATAWYGMAVPSKTPPEHVEVLRASANKALADPKFRSRFAPMGLLPLPPKTGAETERYVREERQRWVEVVKKNQITLD